MVKKASDKSSFDEFDMDMQRWRGNVVSTLENIVREQSKMDGKISEHCKEQQALLNKYLPEFNKQTELLNHIIKELPDKGFCGKMEKMYTDIYPDGDEAMPKKVDILWYDRKIMKWLVALSVGALITGLINLGVRFFG
jgi:hypothetical protein